MTTLNVATAPAAAAAAAVEYTVIADATVAISNTLHKISLDLDFLPTAQLLLSRSFSPRNVVTSGHSNGGEQAASPRAVPCELHSKNIDCRTCSACSSTCVSRVLLHVEHPGPGSWSSHINRHFDRLFRLRRAESRK